MNYILGSGIVGLLARKLLGPKWKLLPVARSRFFTYKTALDDNFIIRDPRLDPVLTDLNGGIAPAVYQYKVVTSASGLLSPGYQDALCRSWALKVYGAETPAHLLPYLKSRFDFFIYGLRVNALYQALLTEFQEEIMTGAALGTIDRISAHSVVINGQNHDYDNLISTVPLPALLKWLHNDVTLKSATTHYLHIKSKTLNFEGANQSLVADHEFDFYKVTNIAPQEFLFYCHRDLGHPGLYLMPIIGDFEIIDGTAIRDAIILGASMPDLSKLEEQKIYCVGSYAQWDCCADIGTNILRLLALSKKLQ